MERHTPLFSVIGARVWTADGVGSLGHFAGLRFRYLSFASGAGAFGTTAAVFGHLTAHQYIVSRAEFVLISSQ